jgi:hypothetical protein
MRAEPPECAASRWRASLGRATQHQSYRVGAVRDAGRGPDISVDAVAVGKHFAVFVSQTDRDRVHAKRIHVMAVSHDGIRGYWLCWRRRTDCSQEPWLGCGKISTSMSLRCARASLPRGRCSCCRRTLLLLLGSPYALHTTTHPRATLHTRLLACGCGWRRRDLNRECGRTSFNAGEPCLVLVVYTPLSLTHTRDCAAHYVVGADVGSPHNNRVTQVHLTAQRAVAFAVTHHGSGLLETCVSCE